MNICILSSSDGRYGGFSAIFRLHKALRRYGHSSIMLVANKKMDDNDSIEVGRYKYIINRLFLHVARFFRALTEKNHESEYYFEHSIINLFSVSDLFGKIPFKPDVIIAGWVNGFVSVKVLHELSSKTGATVIWYLMDMEPLTGGCHFAWDCRKYTTTCGNCPAIKSSSSVDASRKNILIKQNYIAKTNLVVAPATEWLSQQVDNSSVFKGKKKLKIMLSVDEKIFRPAPRITIRKKLNLSQNSKIIFFGATSLDFKRKGMAYLYQALELLDNKLNVRKERILILTAGASGSEEIRTQISNNYQHVHLGYLKNDILLASAYQASNLYVCSSIEDSGPMMINESIICGTPVVSFEMGGALDLVHTGKTGYRANFASSEDLAAGIEYVLTLPEEKEREMSICCREYGLKYCSPKSQVDSFNTLFSEL